MSFQQQKWFSFCRRIDYTINLFVSIMQLNCTESQCLENRVFPLNHLFVYLPPHLARVILLQNRKSKIYIILRINFFYGFLYINLRCECENLRPCVVFKEKRAFNSIASWSYVRNILYLMMKLNISSKLLSLWWSTGTITIALTTHNTAHRQVYFLSTHSKSCYHYAMIK